MEIVNFVFFTFGDRVNHGRTILAANSLLITNRWLNKSNSNLIIYTDSPDYFKDKFIGFDHTTNFIIIFLDQKSIREMKGPMDFVHRIKICLIQSTLERFEGSILYFDSDILITADLSGCMEKLKLGSSLMHQYEYAFSSYKFAEKPTIEEEFYDYYSKQKITIGEKDYSYNEQMASYNAGVIGLDKSQQYLLGDVFYITDVLYSAVKHHACEQFAFSLVLQTNTELHTCEAEIYHYWHRIKKKIVDDNLEIFLDALKKKPHLKAVLEVRKYIEGHFDWNQWLLFHYYDAGRYSNGDMILLKILITNPFRSTKFYKDVLYHCKKRFARRY